MDKKKVTFLVLAFVIIGIIIHLMLSAAEELVVSSGEGAIGEVQAEEIKPGLTMPEYDDSRVMMKGEYDIKELESEVVRSQIDDATFYLYVEDGKVHVLLLSTPLFEGEDVNWIPEGGPDTIENKEP